MRTRQPLAQTKANGLKRTRDRIRQKAEFDEAFANYAVAKRKQIEMVRKHLTAFYDLIFKIAEASRKKAK